MGCGWRRCRCWRRPMTRSGLFCSFETVGSFTVGVICRCGAVCSNVRHSQMLTITCAEIHETDQTMAEQLAKLFKLSSRTSAHEFTPGPQLCLLDCGSISPGVTINVRQLSHKATYDSVGQAALMCDLSDEFRCMVSCHPFDMKNRCLPHRA